jgi:hypothetical protein
LSEASEEIVEYWLNVVRGFFTLRGLKVGIREIDFLAVKPDGEARSKLIGELEKLGVRVVKFEDVLKEVQDSLTTATYTRPALRMIQYYKYIPEW